MNTPAPEDQTVLEARARALAGETRALSRPVSDRISFLLGGTRYGLPLAAVRAVLRLSDYTPVPGADGPLFAVTHHRGDLLPLVDLRRLLGETPAGLPDLAQVVVLGGAEDAVGLLVDQVEQSAGDGVLLPLPATLPEGVRALFDGVTVEGVQVLNVAGLLKDPRLTLGG